MDLKRGALIATAAAALFGMSACGDEESDNVDSEQELVRCQGINDCAGTSECAGAEGTNDCAGKNSCKGEGWVTVSEEDCEAKEGTVLGPAE